MAAPVKDVVCGMDVDPDTAPAKSDYRGVAYYFCAVGCKQEFDANPGKYLDGGQAPAAAAGRKRWWEFWKA